MKKNVDKIGVKDLVINYIDGTSEDAPTCVKCKRILRPNVNMRDDLDWIEGDSFKQLNRLEDYFESPEINKRSITVLEIGAGPAQPIAKKLAETFLKNDKYRCALIRINPVKERFSQFEDEKNYFKELIKR